MLYSDDFISILRSSSHFWNVNMQWKFSSVVRYRKYTMHIRHQSVHWYNLLINIKLIFMYNLGKANNCIKVYATLIIHQGFPLWTCTFSWGVLSPSKQGMQSSDRKHPIPCSVSFRFKMDENEQNTLLWHLFLKIVYKTFKAPQAQG